MASNWNPEADKIAARLEAQLRQREARKIIKKAEQAANRRRDGETRRKTR